jgi:uncharacterized protein DUF6448
MKNIPYSLVVAVAATLLWPAAARAHCDTMDGPVVTTARKALETGKLGPVLAWLKPEHEAEVKEAFKKTLAARKLGKEAKEIADTYFFETVVRLHRAGEGAPYTGLLPAGSERNEALAAADRSIDSGKIDPVVKLLDDSVKKGLADRYQRLRALKPPADDVAKGREWVEAYVAYVHYVVGVFGAATGAGGEAGEGGHAEHE